MKVNLDLNEKKIKQVNDISFGGYTLTKSDNGFREIEFSFPYDEDKKECYLEIYKLAKDANGNYYTTGRAYTERGGDRYKMNPGSNKIDMAKVYGFDDKQPFAYHYLLVDKSSHFVDTHIDAGDVIDERNGSNENRNIFNIVDPSRSAVTRGSSMKLVIIDSQHVGYVYNDKNMYVKDAKLERRAQEGGIKTIANKWGGTLAGLEYAIDNGEYDSYGRIISLPIFTDDSFSAHAYWNKNCYQMVNSLGNINNYASLQRKMFAHGINFVSDGAFVNEGLEGVHFTHMLKWGENSPYLNWFKASGIKNTPLSLGIFAKNKDCISHKIVNSPYNYQQNPNGQVIISKNNKYNSKKPTYIQFYDKRLVTDEEKNDTTSLIKTYSIMSTPNVFKLHSHNDSIFPYSFEIDPERYNKNIKYLNEYNKYLDNDKKIEYKSPLATRILSKYDYFNVDEKFESGFDTWDANPDIGKLNFSYSNSDNLSIKNLPPNERQRAIEKILQGNCQVQDYAVMSGAYWTQKTDDILRMHVAQSLKAVDKSNPSLVFAKIKELSNGEVLPKTAQYDVTQKEVYNILKGLYNNKRKLSEGSKDEQILEGLMNVPLDSIEFGDNIVSVLASPLVSKRAAAKEDIGLTRYDLYKKGNPNLLPEFKVTYEKMDELYKKELSNTAKAILDNVNDMLPEDRKLFDGDEVTEFGQYTLPIITESILKYSLIKALAPNIKVNIDEKTGEIAYDYNALKDVHLQSLGITNPASPADEAKMLMSSIKSGLANVDTSKESEITNSIFTSLKNTNANSFKLADLIIDKTQAGLDWRIDATKDIADVEALRKKQATFEYTWQNVIDFWKKFVDAVVAKNPNAYTVAEITDERNLFDTGYGWHSEKYPKGSAIIPKFIRETGMTAIANYTQYFRDISKLFTKDTEDGASYSTANDRQEYIYKMLLGKNEDDSFIHYSGNLDALRYTYTFIGNHDKPRALHCAALDMAMYCADLTYKDDKEKRLTAYKVINDKFLENVTEKEVYDYDFSAVSPKAVAMADALRPAFIDMLNKYRGANNFSSDEEFNKAFIPISKAIADLANGKFKGEHFDADAFGVKPFDVTINMVIEQAEYAHEFYLPADLKKNFANDVFEAVMQPALSKMLGMMKYLVALPGIPTLFDGDDKGVTGSDTKTKNMYLQGRQQTHEEWVTKGSPKYKEFLAKYKGYIDEVMAVRQKPECNALNNGAIFTLPIQTSNEKVKVPAIFRESSDGKMAISLFNTSALHSDYKQFYRPDEITLDSIQLNFETKADGKTIMLNGTNNVGIPGLKNMTKFYNAKDPNDFYVVNEHDGKYFIKSGTGDGKIHLKDSTLILYSTPKNAKLSFTGQYHIKQNSDFVANAYAPNKVEAGKKLLLVK